MYINIILNNINIQAIIFQFCAILLMFNQGVSQLKNKIKSLLMLYLTFFKIGLFTFGGGFSMIGLMQDILVDKKKWISSEDMLDIVAIAESTPGPIAINTATFIGFKKQNILGAILATLGVITPSIIIICVIAVFYDKFMQIELVQKAFKGILSATIVLVLNAAIKLFKPLTKKGNLIINIVMVIIALAIMLLFNFSAIIIIIAGGLIGWIIYTLIIKEVK